LMKSASPPVGRPPLNGTWMTVYPDRTARLAQQFWGLRSLRATR
jgi:hypothetical protein